MTHPKPPIVVIVDPISSGVELESAAAKSGLSCLRLDTIPQSARLGPLGPYLPTNERFPLNLQHEVRYDSFLNSGLGQEFSDQIDAIAAAVSVAWTPIAVIPGSEVGVQISDFLASRWRLPGNDPGLVRARRHKGEMKRAVAASGLPLMLIAGRGQRVAG